MQTYRWSLNSEYVKPFERRLVATIKRGEIQSLYTRISSLGHRTTAATVCRSLRAMLAFAESHGWIAANPATKLGLKGAQSDAAPMVRWREGAPTDFRELVATLAAIDTLGEARPLSPWPFIYRLCALTGLRPSVVEGLRWEELDLGRKPMLHLPAARSKLKDASSIPLSDATAEMLRALNPRDSGLVFPGRSGNRPIAKPYWEPIFLKSVLGAEAKRHGWPEFRQARLRDTFQQWCEITGQDARGVDLLVGHQTKTTTRRRFYTTFSPVEEARKIANAWAAVIKAERSKARRKGRK